MKIIANERLCEERQRPQDPCSRQPCDLWEERDMKKKTIIPALLPTLRSV